MIKKSFIPDEKYESSVSNSTVLKVLALIIEDLKASRVLLIEKLIVLMLVSSRILV